MGLCIHTWACAYIHGPVHTYMGLCIHTWACQWHTWACQWLNSEHELLCSSNQLKQVLKDAAGHCQKVSSASSAHKVELYYHCPRT